MAWDGPIGRRLWRALGGTLDEAGHPELGPDDWLVVFVGSSRDTTLARGALIQQGLEPRDATVPDAYLVAGEERRAIEIAGPEAAAAGAVLEGIDSIGNAIPSAAELAEQERILASGPRHRAHGRPGPPAHGSRTPMNAVAVVGAFVVIDGLALVAVLAGLSALDSPAQQPGTVPGLVGGLLVLAASAVLARWIRRRRAAWRSRRARSGSLAGDLGQPGAVTGHG